MIPEMLFFLHNWIDINDYDKIIKMDQILTTYATKSPI